MKERSEREMRFSLRKKRERRWGFGGGGLGGSVRKR